MAPCEGDDGQLVDEKKRNDIMGSTIFPTQIQTSIFGPFFFSTV